MQSEPVHIENSALRRRSSNPEIALKQQEMIDAIYQLHMTRKPLWRCSDGSLRNEKEA